MQPVHIPYFEGSCGQAANVSKQGDLATASANGKSEQLSSIVKQERESK